MFLIISTLFLSLISSDKIEQMGMKSSTQLVDHKIDFLKLQSCLPSLSVVTTVRCQGSCVAQTVQTLRHFEERHFEERHPLTL